MVAIANFSEIWRAGAKFISPISLPNLATLICAINAQGYNLEEIPKLALWTFIAQIRVSDLEISYMRYG